jgi:tRNA uridine 5-carbamoylmethylation protein Kti12
VAEITFIIGLPASGKTTLGRTLGVPLIEDAKEIPTGIEGDFALDSPFFCEERSLLRAQSEALKVYPDHTHVLIFFKNSPRQCLLNSQKRHGKRVSGLIRYMSQRYAPPADAIPVWDSVENTS